jgi:hypothetical protein
MVLSDMDIIITCLLNLVGIHFECLCDSEKKLEKKCTNSIKYDKQDQQVKAAFNERNPLTTQQQEPLARSPGGPQTKTGQDTRQRTDRPITKMTNNL